MFFVIKKGKIKKTYFSFFREKMREFKQLSANIGYYRTVKDTMWLYPIDDIEKAFSNTSYQYIFDGTHIICPNLSNLVGLYSDIYQQTTISQPLGNQGYSLGVGTFLQNFGKTLYWQAPNGNTIIKWQLVQQITEQSTLPVPANSPQGTVGYVTIYNTQGSTPVLDGPYVVLAGGLNVTPLDM